MRLPSWSATKRPPSSLVPLLVLYVACIVRFHLRDELQVQTFTPLNVAILLSGVFTLFTIAYIGDILAPGSRVLKFLMSAGLVFVYVALSTYHLRTHVLLDYSVIAENISLAFHRDSMTLVSQIPHKDDYILLIGFLIPVGLLQWKWNVPARQPPGRGSRWLLPIVLLGGYVGCLQFLPYSYDEITCFTQSAYKHYFPQKSPFQVPSPAERFPYVTELVNARRDHPPKNVFIIMIESFNANFVRSKTPEGKEYTPFFNELTREGLFFDNFWGNSVQTAKGQLSVLASIPDLTAGKVFTQYPELNLHCLPQVMKENDFETLYFQGQPSLFFDNTGVFMKRNGFEHVHAVDEFLSPDEKSRYRWGWGVQDDILYQRTFQYLDAVSRTNRSSSKDQRLFVVLATISNHAKFRSMPPSQCYLYAGHRSKKQDYANSIRLTDEYLKAFFQELKSRDYLSNSIVFITGDHSFPVGEHGYYDSESGSYKEYFKTSLLIWGSGITPATSHETRSQLDIAPTVLDLLGISAKVHFTGKSLFHEAPSAIPLVQPYAGTCLGVVSYPYKFVYNIRSEQEYLFDLSKDPLERTNIVKTVAKQPLHETLRRKVADILLNDRLINENRIWPPPSEVSPETL